MTSRPTRRPIWPNAASSKTSIKGNITLADQYKSIKTVLPRGVAIWPSLNTPDTKWNAAGVYATRLAFSADDPALIPLREKVSGLIAERLDEEKAKLIAAGKKGLVSKLRTADPFKVEVDDETGDETGRIILNAKMTATGISKKTQKPWTRKPAIFNAAGVVLKNPPMIGSGSELKVSVELSPYFVAKDQEVGVSFRMEAVQVLKLVQFGARDASAFGFASEEGDDISDQTSDFADETSNGATDEDL
jgi:hypothetical protein